MNKPTRRRTRSGFGTGTTSLLMIFTVLCFATLAMLTLSTAASNARIQQRSLQGAAALEEAKGQAAKAMAQLDAALAGAPDDADLAQLALSEGWQAGDAKNRFQLTLSIQEDQELLTVVEIGPGREFRLIRQTSAYTGQWQPGPEGQFWNGGAP